MKFYRKNCFSIELNFILLFLIYINKYFKYKNNTYKLIVINKKLLWSKNKKLDKKIKKIIRYIQ